MTCTSCGAGVPDGARFCPSCGQTLVERPDERRIATVLFADLVGFTTFSEASDPEHVKNLVDGCFDRLAADVTAFGGRVDKIVGDALVALFGAPVAHEDDPERAVRAALALQDSMAAFCADHGVSVQLRIGVNTGEVLVGRLRAGDDYTAMGDVVNIASRLQAAAEPATVLVGSDTYDATRTVIRYEPAGTLALRGREQPMTTWSAREVLTRPGRRLVRGDTPLVGREAELAVLREAVVGARTRRRALLLLLLGEAGVGKTRLASEIPRCEEAVPATVLVGQCVPYGESNVWLPMGDAVRDLLDLDAVDGDADLEHELAQRLGEVLGLSPDDDETTRVATGLMSLIGGSDVSTDVDPGRARDEAVRSVQVLLEALTEASLVVLVLSDLHWADDVILELVDLLLTRLRDRPFVLLATARPELGERWTPSTRHEANVMHLDPLDADATTLLIRSHLGSETPDAVIELLLERSGGNPFFIEELAALAAESNVATTGRAPHGGPEERIRAMPATLRGLVAARLDALDVDTREVLEDCAVVGPTGPVRLIEALGKARGETDVERRLHELARRDLLTADNFEYSFRSEMIREIGYGTLTKAERARRHAAVAEWTEREGSIRENETDRLEQLALHYGTAAALARELGGFDELPADLYDRAILAHETAARHAERSESWPRAEGHFDAAIALSEDATDVDRLLGRARARVERHRLDEARADIDRAIELADASHDPSVRIRALLVRGLFEHRGGDRDASVASYDEAIQLARAQGNEQAIADGLRGRGLSLMFGGDLDGAEEAIGPALEIFRAIDDHRGEAWALQNLAWIAFYRGQPALADERLEAAIETFAEIRDWGGLDWALGLLAWVRFNQGRLGEAEELAQHILTDSADTGDLWALGMMGVLLAQVALWTGHPPRAIDASIEAQQRFEVLDDAYGVLQSMIPRARALACLGRLDEARSAIEAMAKAASTTASVVPTLPLILTLSIGGHLGDAAWLDRARPSGAEAAAEGIGISAEEQQMAGALLMLQRGDVQSARPALERAYQEASSDAAEGAAGGILAMARAADGDAESALSLTTGLVELEVGSYLDRLQAWMARAFAAAQLDRPSEASAAADRAVELADATESPLDHALARLARAVVAERSGLADANRMRNDADERMERLGVTASGWVTAFRLAAHGADAPAPSR